MVKRLLASCFALLLGAWMLPACVQADGTAVLPAYYDAREDGKAPVIREQNGLNTCWAMTACSALEAALLPEKDMVFATDHASLNNAFDILQSEGGDYKMIMAYLSGWQGPVMEADDPYGDGESDPSLTPAVHVQEMRMYTNEEPETLKQAILTYGPIQTSLYMERNMASGTTMYYKEETGGFFYPDAHETTHDVLILGWDDDYSRENFSTFPKGDGAWICQNTWGDDFGDKGIFYISYEDANAAKRALAYSGIEETDNYNHIYQNDDCGWQGSIGYNGSESCYMANVYTAESDEWLKAVSFYSVSRETDYEVYIVRNFQDKSSFDDMTRAATGKLDAKGYFTVQLDEAVELSAGERFAVCVKVTTKNWEKPVAIERYKDWFTHNVVTDGKEGYISKDGQEWTNIEKRYDSNICLKAFTIDK